MATRRTKRWLCRLGIHAWLGVAANIAGHESWRERMCSRCEQCQRQRMNYGFTEPSGPWLALPNYAELNEMVYTVCIYCLSREHGGADCPTKRERTRPSRTGQNGEDADA